jgi:hypothetical protein
MMSDYRTGAGAFAIFLLLGAAADAQNLPAGTQPPAGCAPVQAPVCGVLAGERQSYWNACLAQRAGAIILRPGECPNRTFIGY